MKKVAVLSILTIFIPLIMLAGSAKTLFEVANNHYSKGKFSQSIAIYDSLINQNMESSAIYYNLGNAWYKMENIPMAIYYYEKAKKIEPNNSDIIYNLELANTQIADRIEAVPEFFLKSWWKTILYTFNEGEWMKINIGLFLLSLAFIIIYITSRKPGTKKLSLSLTLSLLSLFFISGIIGYRSYKIKTTHNTAIIFTPTVNVKSAPDEKSSTIFILHQGTKVSLMDETSEWQKVKIANGSKGWLLKTNLKTI